MSQSRRSFRIVMTAIISLGTLLLILDLYEIIAGKPDLNRHLPLLLPGELFAFAYIFFRVDRLCERLDASEKSRAEEPNRGHDRGP